jgi:hypothetical protein
MVMSNCDEDQSIQNTLLELEIVIDRPVAQVWRQWLDIGSWVTSHNIENVHGTPGTVGSITRPSFKMAPERGMPLPHHHYCKIIKLDPERQYVLKTYSEKGGSYGMQIVGFDDARFIAVDGKTKITFRFFGELKAKAFRKGPSINLDDDNHMMKNLENLKRIVESSDDVT